jgi:hypothetical protein
VDVGQHTGDVADGEGAVSAKARPVSPLAYPWQATPLGIRGGIASAVRPLWRVGPAGQHPPVALVLPQGKDTEGETAYIAHLLATAPQLLAVLEALVVEANMSQRRGGRCEVQAVTVAQAAALVRQLQGDESPC